MMSGGRDAPRVGPCPEVSLWIQPAPRGVDLDEKGCTEEKEGGGSARKRWSTRPDGPSRARSSTAED